MGEATCPDYICWKILPTVGYLDTFKKNSSCEIEVLVEGNLCNLRVIHITQSQLLSYTRILVLAGSWLVRPANLRVTAINNSLYFSIKSRVASLVLFCVYTSPGIYLHLYFAA